MSREMEVTQAARLLSLSDRSTRRLRARMVIWDGARELLTTPAPLDAVQVRALSGARVVLGSMPPSAADATKPAPDHRWRR